MMENLVQEEEDIEETISVNVVETLAVMVSEEVGKYIQLEQ